ncbi:hypothetical protein RRG08_021209 [Elysia crispata]|uniref:Uncharacterized protein n=1 Tax=Elysia crispata TaxID=231223 RepID=A0AAE1DCB2_9GAST|nr:hypothetical protein RRG08_021209 [Elysia crispata]
MQKGRRDKYVNAVKILLLKNLYRFCEGIAFELYYRKQRKFVLFSWTETSYLKDPDLLEERGNLVIHTQTTRSSRLHLTRCFCVPDLALAGTAVRRV